MAAAFLTPRASDWVVRREEPVRCGHPRGVHMPNLKRRDTAGRLPAPQAGQGPWAARESGQRRRAPASPTTTLHLPVVNGLRALGRERGCYARTSQVRPDWHKIRAAALAPRGRPGTHSTGQISNQSQDFRKKHNICNRDPA